MKNSLYALVVAILLGHGAEAACTQVPMPKTFESLGISYGTAARKLGIRGLYPSSRGQTMGIQADDSTVSLLGEQEGGLLINAMLVVTNPGNEVDFARFQALSASVFAAAADVPVESVSADVERLSQKNRKDRRLSTLQRGNYVGFFAEPVPEQPQSLSFSVFRCRFE